MKVYVVWCQDNSDYVGWIVDIFSDKEKAKKHILEQFPDAVYNKKDGTYDDLCYYYEIREWEVK